MALKVSGLYSRLEAQLKTPSGKLVIVAVTATILTTGTILTSQAVRRRTKRHRLRDEIEDEMHGDSGMENGEEMVDFTQGPYKPTGSDKDIKGKKKPTNDIIVRESLARNYAFFGEEGMKKIRSSFVIVVGLGGVGSAAATMLVRSGIGKIRLIDFDQVSLSSLNRHSTATLAQVGTPKVVSCAAYFESVAPWVDVDARIALFGQEEAEVLLSDKPDYVIDCIDNIDTKVELLAYCHSHQIPVFSSLGAASKSDPSRIQISDISTTFEDPLARSVRRKLKIQNGIQCGIPVVYSTEKPRSEIALLPLPDEEFEKGKVDELSPIANFRVRILPVLGPLPAMFGNAAAAYVLQRLGGFEVESLPIKNRRKTAATMHRELASLELKLTGNPRIPIDEADVQYLYEEIHRTRSVSPPYDIPANPTLMRWKKENGLNWDNLVVFSRDEATRHKEHCLLGNEDPEEYWGTEVTDLVNKRIAEERRLRHYRMGS